MARSPEQAKQYHTSKAFKALNTKANRTAIDENEFSWLENVQPVGFGNLKGVATSSAVPTNTSPFTWSNTVTELSQVNINNSEYIIAFLQNGGAQYYNLSNNTSGTVASAGTFTGTGMRSRQWKNERSIIADPQKGYFTWDGNSVVSVGCIGTIAVTYPGQGYIQNPVVTISAPNDANGIQATALASISNAAGTITGFSITAIGTGYTSVPKVIIGPPQSPYGVQAVGSAVISGGNVVGISIVNGGQGYTSPPSVSFSGGAGSGATAVATVGTGLVTAITLTEAGSGYSSPPTITISGGQSANSTSANIARTNNVATLNTSSAHGLFAGDRIVISGFTTNSSFNASNVAVISTPTNVSFTYASTGSNLAATVDTTGTIGYAPATAIASYVSFASGIVGLTLTGTGAGYTSTPTVNITGGGGTNAAATAIVVGNIVTGLVMTNLGSGYTSNPTVTITGGGATINATAKALATTTTNADIASYQGRVWIAQGRNVFYSAAGSYSDFISVSAGSINLTDDTLHSNILNLTSANNFLYVFGIDSINVFSDVRVGGTGQTVFTNTNVSASIGSKRIDAVFPYFRSLLFANEYGIYALVGATTTKLSDALDGIYPLLDLTQPITGGQVLINSILCAAFNVTYNDPVLGSRPIQLVFFDKKWFITSQGSVARMIAVPFNGNQYLYATDGTSLFSLYSDTVAPIATTVQTALWPMGDPIRDKQALKYAFEASVPYGGVFNVNVDSESESATSTVASLPIKWIDNYGLAVGWQNNSGQNVVWYSATTYGLFKSDAQQYGKYLGLTITSVNPGITINTIMMEHELRARF